MHVLTSRRTRSGIARGASILWVLAGLAAVPLAASLLLSPLRIANAATGAASTDAACGYELSIGDC